MPRANSIPARIVGLLAVSEGQWTRGEIAAALGIGYMSAHGAIVAMRTSHNAEYRELVETRIKRAPNTGGSGKSRDRKPEAKEPIDEPDYRPTCVAAPKIKLDLNAAFRAAERKPEPDWRWDWQRERPPTQTGQGRASDVP